MCICRHILKSQPYEEVELRQIQGSHCYNEYWSHSMVLMSITPASKLVTIYKLPYNYIIVMHNYMYMYIYIYIYIYIYVLVMSRPLGMLPQ